MSKIRSSLVVSGEINTPKSDVLRILKVGLEVKVGQGLSSDFGEKTVGKVLNFQLQKNGEYKVTIEVTDWNARMLVEDGVLNVLSIFRTTILSIDENEENKTEQLEWVSLLKEKKPVGKAMLVKQIQF